MGSGKKKQPSYQATESTIAPAIAVAEPVLDAVSHVATETVLSDSTQSLDPETALVADEPHEVILAEPLLQEADAAVGESKAEPVSLDRKSTRLNSSHVKLSYAVFCL